MILKKYKKHFIKSGTILSDAMKIMNQNVPNNILFIIDDNDKLLGSLSDGDIRRGLLRGHKLNSDVIELMNQSPKFINHESYQINKIIEFRNNNIKILPVLNKEGRIKNIIDFSKKKSHLPIDVVIMAGGRGSRLKPLTNSTPKPLLEIDKKPILEYILDNLVSFGIENFWISINYLGDQIVSYFGDGTSKNITIDYVCESIPMGTIGAISKIDDFKHDYVLITNSDLICNLNYEDFLKTFLDEDADLAVLTIPYSVTIPYAVVELKGNVVKSLKEKPTYNYPSNGGIYLVKSKILSLIPNETFFNATDLIEKAVEENLKVISYSFSGYWLDIGRTEDFEKAQTEIKQVIF